MTPEWRRKMAFKSIAIATGILLAFAFGGAWLLEQIHVSIDAFRIAGGLLLFLIAVDMLFEKRSERREERAEQVAAQQAEHPEHAGRYIRVSARHPADRRAWAPSRRSCSSSLQYEDIAEPRRSSCWVSGPTSRSA
jgi:hypothetical protein